MPQYPPIELPGHFFMNKIKLTKQGHAKMKEEHEDLVKNKKQKAIDRLQKARAMGDLSENSEYTAAKEDLAFIEGRELELTMMLDNVEIIEENNVDMSVIKVGHKVIVESTNGRHEYMIVGEFEADPMNKKLSHTSPIGKALIGKKRGQKVKITIPAGVIEYTIIEIK